MIAKLITSILSLPNRLIIVLMMKIINLLKKKNNDYSGLERRYSEQTHKPLYDEPNFQPELLDDLSVSVIIPYYNSKETIAILMESLKHQLFNKDNFEVIIVDDGSTEQSKDYLENLLHDSQFRITLVRHKNNLGRSAARNSGAYIARNDVLLFVDSDVILPSNFIFNHAIKHKFSDSILLVSLKEPVKLAQLLTDTLKENNFNFKANKHNDWRYYAELQNRTIKDIEDTRYFKDFGFFREYFSKTLPEMVITTAISIRKESFYNAGGFSQDFIGWGREDVFFGAMAIATGVYIIPDLTSVYQIKRTSEYLEKEKKQQLTANKQTYYALLEKDLESVIMRNQARFLDFHDKVESIKVFRPKLSDFPTASIIIPVYSDLRLRKCLQSLNCQSINRANYEIIVVEDSPEKQFEELSRKFGARYAHIEDKSIPKARNRAIEISNQETIISTDSDCVLPYFWLEEMLLKLKTERIIGGPIRNFVTEHNAISRYGHTPGNGQRKPNYLPITDLPYIVTANAGFYREDLLAVGGFDEELLSGCDVDICYKLALRGLKPVIADKAMIWHEDRTTLKKYFQRFYKYANYHLLLFKKYQQVSGKQFFVNHYPTKKIFGGLLRIGLGLVQSRKDKIITGLLDIVEGVSLTSGYLAGMIQHRRIYLP